MLPNDPQVTLRSAVVIVPRVEGTTVPAAAVRSAADGRTYVVTESGEVDVTVLGSGQGVAVVEGQGITPGTRVQVTGEGAGMQQPLSPQPAPAPAPGGQDGDSGEGDPGGEGVDDGSDDGSGSTQDG